MVGSVTEKVMTGVLPGVVGVTLTMLYLNLEAAALSLVGKLCATTISCLVVNLPAPWRLIEVTDFPSGKKLDPQQAYFVDGSRKVLCSHDAPMFDETKHMEPMTFDRCSPGAYAFARREDAEKFVSENGGIVLRLAQLLQGVNSR